MQNVGEEIAGEYLRILKGCDFIQYNLYTPDTQGEIDVIGINLKQKSVYICEVAIHLTTGLMYVDQKTNRTNNVRKLTDKFRRDIRYVEKYFAEYDKHFMLWSPIVKTAKATSKESQIKHVEDVRTAIEKEFGYTLELIINKEYAKRFDELKQWAGVQTKEQKSPVLRFMQIEAKLMAHNARYK